MGEWGTGVNNNVVPRIAENAITRGKAVILGTLAGEVDLAGAAAVIRGIANHDALATEPIPITPAGDVGFATAGAAVAVNVPLETDATGRFILRVAGPIVGYSIEAAAAANDEFAVHLVEVVL